ncbi:hypothetical protein B7494_g5196 [Chlorociboria aeruginascens]|nr:hypothetical protein B7494_g5196 [Chlorociboria aeruginascens]
MFKGYFRSKLSAQATRIICILQECEGTTRGVICEDTTKGMICEGTTRDITYEGTTKGVICEGTTRDITYKGTTKGVICEGTTRDITYKGTTKDMPEKIPISPSIVEASTDMPVAAVCCPISQFISAPANGDTSLGPLINGEIEHAAVPIPDLLANLFTSPQFEDTIQYLISSQLIESGSGALGKRKFTIKPGVRDHIREALPDQESLEWSCLVLICHAFPGRHEEMGFGDITRALMLQVRHVFSYCRNLLDQIIRCPDKGYSKLSALELVERILSRRPQFGSRTLYLQKFRAQRARDISCRLPNMSIESLCEEQSSIDSRTNALYGEHLRSNAQEILMSKTITITGSLDNAYEELSKFGYFTTVPSEMEKIEKYQHDFFCGKIYRWKAQFCKASDVFDRLYKSDHFIFNDNSCNIIGHLVGTLCEQGKLDTAESIARQLIKGLEQYDQQGYKRTGLTSFRLLQLSLAETLICKALVNRANGVMYTDEIVQKLEESKSMLQSLREGYRLGKSREAELLLNRARQTFEVVGREYWWTCYEGKVALKAFEFFNTGLPMAFFSLFYAIKLKPEEKSRFWNTYLPWGIKNGLVSKSIIAVYWEEELDTDVDVLRDRLGIEKPFNLRKLRKADRERQSRKAR